MDPLLDRAPCGFMVVRDDGYVELANATMAEMLWFLAGRAIETGGVRREGSMDSQTEHLVGAGALAGVRRAAELSVR